jgi:polar amino acid transport system substrate-binding protein
MQTIPRTQSPFTHFARTCTLLAAGLMVSSVHALDITTEDNAPFNYVDNQQVTGISTEILQEVGKRAGVPLKIQVLPWARAYQSALNLPDTCVYSTVKLPERETLFKWVGPLTTNKWALFAKSDFSKPLNSIEDAKHYRIGGVTMDAKAMYLKSQGFTSIDLVGDDNLNLAKLIAGRIDLWISGLYKGKESAAHVGSKMVKPVMVVREVDYYLACNLKTSDATIAALAQALGTAQKDGFVKAVTERYSDRTQ